MLKNLNDFHLFIDSINDISDLHITSDQPCYCRKNDKIFILSPKKVFTLTEINNLAKTILNDYHQKILSQKGHTDISYQVNKKRLRINFYFTQEKLSLSIRFIKNKLWPIDKYDEILFDLINKPSGLILVTGPCGSGKSSTLSTLINYRLKNPCHLITLEDPIEYLFSIENSLIHQREYLTDFHDFSTALKGALRQDPDIIMVGEIRDEKTMSAALTAAKTGHLVLSTLHTNNCIDAISRIEGFFDGVQRNNIRLDLALTLQAIIAQKLLYLPSKTICAREILINTPAIKNLIISGNTQQILTQMQLSNNLGMRTMEIAMKYFLDKTEF